MKTILSLIFLAVLVLKFNILYSQEACKVLKPEIAAKYSGKCKNGLAHGKGTAEGQDKYTGRFKNGLPHGQGIYTWATGEKYEGSWKEGKKDGEGKYTYKKDGVDSIRIGIWKNDIFVKKIKLNPYRVLRSLSVSRYSVRRVGDGNKVIFIILQNGNPSTGHSNLFLSANNGSSISVGPNQGFENIIFPFTCRVTFSMLSSFRTSRHDVEFEIEILEPGNWEVVINN